MAAPKETQNTSSLHSKVVLITGASSGIGRSTAFHFAKLGAHLVITGRDVEAIKDVETQCKSVGCEIVSLTGDLCGDQFREELIEKALERFSRLDVLVNNAGIQVGGSILNTSLADYDKQMDINVRSVYHLTMLAIPHLIKTQGNIVNVSSCAGLRAFPGVVSYCVSKSAIDQFTKCVALDLATKQVRCNSVNPGVIATNLHRRAGQSEEQYEQFLENCKKSHPLGRVGQADEVAKAIAYLASDDASFTTGSHLCVDGGRACCCPR